MLEAFISLTVPGTHKHATTENIIKVAYTVFWYSLYCPRLTLCIVHLLGPFKYCLQGLITWMMSHCRMPVPVAAEKMERLCHAGLGVPTVVQRWKKNVDKDW